MLGDEDALVKLGNHRNANSGNVSWATCDMAK
jgi:hypothetical protein